ncbi:hypothetical protein HMI51_12760 [Corallococcus coralloides]|nr:hypothetical protein [Corallococcus coralloides]
MRLLQWLKEAAEYVGGATEAPPPGLNLPLSSVGWGLWWTVLLLLIAMFCGQSSKFIYIDF